MPWSPTPPPVRLLTEPDAAERHRYQLWMVRHYAELMTAWLAAEALSRAYDRAAVVTSADGNPEVPSVMGAEIADLYTRWEARRWAGQKKHSA